MKMPERKRMINVNCLKSKKLLLLCVSLSVYQAVCTRALIQYKDDILPG